MMCIRESIWIKKDFLIQLVSINFLTLLSRVLTIKSASWAKVR